MPVFYGKGDDTLIPRTEEGAPSTDQNGNVAGGKNNRVQASCLHPMIVLRTCYLPDGLLRFLSGPAVPELPTAEPEAPAPVGLPGVMVECGPGVPELEEEEGLDGEELEDPEPEAPELMPEEDEDGLLAEEGLLALDPEVAEPLALVLAAGLLLLALELVLVPEVPQAASANTHAMGMIQFFMKNSL